jgi:hypothetical protein
MAVLITEASLMSHSVDILRWFSKKKRPGWTIVPRPNIKKWLRHNALESAVEDRERWAKVPFEVASTALKGLRQIYQHTSRIRHLESCFSPLRHHSNSDGDSSSGAESIDGSSNDESNAPLISPSRIPAYGRTPLSKEEGSEERWKNNVLIEYFAWWAVAHAGFHRKLVAITALSNLTYSKCGHVSETGETSTFADKSCRLRFFPRINSCKDSASDAMAKPAHQSLEDHTLFTWHLLWFTLHENMNISKKPFLLSDPVHRMLLSSGGTGLSSYAY